MAHDCHIFNTENRMPTPDECRACEQYETSSVYSEDSAQKYWDLLGTYIKGQKIEGELEKMMQSDQIAHVFNSISIRSHLMSVQMQMMQALTYQKVDLVPTIQTAFAIGYMLATIGLPEDEVLSWVMLEAEEKGVAGEVEDFLKGLKEGTNEGDTSSQDD